MEQRGMEGVTQYKRRNLHPHRSSPVGTRLARRSKTHDDIPTPNTTWDYRGQMRSRGQLSKTGVTEMGGDILSRLKNPELQCIG